MKRTWEARLTCDHGLSAEYIQTHQASLGTVCQVLTLQMVSRR